jgi:phosphoribosyl 1,2-cyclic phosphate phosphodiesterase
VITLTILGSAAAEGWPALFCECAPCAEARRRGGRNVRRRTAYAVNDDVLVDFGPDIYWQTVEFGLDLSKVRHIFVTHSHYDHLSPIELQWRRTGYSAVSSPLHVYGNADVFARIEAEMPASLEQVTVHKHLVEPGDVVTAGTLQVTALEAQHARSEETALNYVLSDGESTVLIANDTGWWSEATWERLRGFSFDVAVIECTYLHRDPEQRSYHLGALATVAVRDRLREFGALRDDCRCVANHFSHNGITLHEELCDFFGPHGIDTGYDGMVIRVG